MSTADGTRGWHGRWYKGAMRDHREAKRLAAIERNARTPNERRSTKRSGPAHARRAG